ncbi:AfsA-related hotdog domain-containing protein [Methylosinus sporium]|uniref:A-factor biosynthesis hotdog domain-containing protein n=1 Tax=Methylosinus sporium TaxID=428 RepID=A0A549T3M3_METSR|nr:AfsA-related hotdog domain-containing protein [Methylosinus sporium]TRL36485.1 hypothetical protein FM996_04830 [Methylosinus sporium]
MRGLCLQPTEFTEKRRFAMMDDRYYFVVGDRFREFADGKDVLTVNQLEALTRLPKTLVGARKVLMLGQGVRQDDVLAILRNCEDDPTQSAKFEIADLRRVTDRADETLSHKRVSHNTLIGAPSRLSADRFKLPLNIDERCELMGDHQTGQHIQGMIVVEAFRQSFLAVTEAFFPLGNEGKTYFVINAMKTEFKNFLFPLPADIIYQIDDKDVNERRARHHVTITVIQNMTECASAEISFTVYPADVIATKEAEMAAQVTRRMIALHMPVPREFSAQQGSRP